MGDPTYDQRQAAAKARAEMREKHEALAEEVGVLMLAGVKDFFEGRAFIVMETTGEGSTRIAFCR